MTSTRRAALERQKQEIERQLARALHESRYDNEARFKTESARATLAGLELKLKRMNGA
jgi:hypothetical protein